MALNLLEIVRDVRLRGDNLLLAGYDFGKGNPSLIPPKVNCFITDGEITRPLRHLDILKGYFPVELSFKDYVMGFLSENVRPERLTLTFAEIIPIQGLTNPGMPPNYPHFHLNLADKTGHAYRPFNAFTQSDAKRYDAIKGVFKNYGWIIEDEKDTTLFGGAVRKPGMPYCPTSKI